MKQSFFEKLGAKREKRKAEKDAVRAAKKTVDELYGPYQSDRNDCWNAKVGNSRTNHPGGGPI